MDIDNICKLLTSNDLGDNLIGLSLLKSKYSHLNNWRSRFKALYMDGGVYLAAKYMSRKSKSYYGLKDIYL